MSYTLFFLRKKFNGKFSQKLFSLISFPLFFEKKKPNNFFNFTIVINSIGSEKRD